MEPRAGVQVKFSHPLAAKLFDKTLQFLILEILEEEKLELFHRLKPKKRSRTYTFPIYSLQFKMVTLSF